MGQIWKWFHYTISSSINFLFLVEDMAENRTTQTACLAQNLPNLKGINFPFNYVLHLQHSSIQKCQILGCMSTANPVITELKTSVAWIWIISAIFADLQSRDLLKDVLSIFKKQRTFLVHKMICWWWVKQYPCQNWPGHSLLGEK